jgi:hypothetical protein
MFRLRNYRTNSMQWITGVHQESYGINCMLVCTGHLQRALYTEPWLRGWEYVGLYSLYMPSRRGQGRLDFHGINFIVHGKVFKFICHWRAINLWSYFNGTGNNSDWIHTAFSGRIILMNCKWWCKRRSQHNMKYILEQNGGQHENLVCIACLWAEI